MSCRSWSTHPQAYMFDHFWVPWEHTALFSGTLCVKLVKTSAGRWQHCLSLLGMQHLWPKISFVKSQEALQGFRKRGRRAVLIAKLSCLKLALNTVYRAFRAFLPSWLRDKHELPRSKASSVDFPVVFKLEFQLDHAILIVLKCFECSKLFLFIAESWLPCSSKGNFSYLAHDAYSKVYRCLPYRLSQVYGDLLVPSTPECELPL